MTDLIYKDETYAIVGAAIEVHKELGHGFLEAVYQEALARELTSRDIPFSEQQVIEILYKGIPLDKKYCADFVCYGKIIIEIKSEKNLTRADEAQLFNYLRATGFKAGILINFGSRGKLEWKKYVM